MTVAVTQPWQTQFSKVFAIRGGLLPESPGESHPKAALSYLYAIEHYGKLYVGYSNNGGNVVRIGKDRELWKNNSAELAVIPWKNCESPRETRLPPYPLEKPFLGSRST